MKKLLSVNIEGDKHLERVGPCIAEENPDVICLQEAFRDDIIPLVGTEYQTEFLPMCLKERRDGSLSQWGIAIATRTPAWRVVRDYYYQPTTTFVPFDGLSKHTKRKTVWQGVVGVTIEDDGADLAIFTTHFTWTPDGRSDEHQTTDMKALLHFMSERGPHILCGDFNIPRKQNSVYPIMTAHYTDHVPPEYETSMFVPLHRVKNDPVQSANLGTYMVDYILSAPPHALTVTNVEMRGNVSDHYALVAQVASGQK
jgi:endonuclease/exonuclease/phosphatase family metal-dependent hydrolase